ncbi:hypothetical protein THAOC_09810 [Thalassiosira oceanica]|uniref:MYND-type domain-containing protein n=1 Tax=Thalassiosira oceanica TaxID=159749 RepID=K0TEK4_THAOC|nr:hypothetical protein THAOC_09810 [Thalassiosira oceanica]|eukprot:EJK68977.1 hypothetical protein THAOC_09810 [Thalassiosira oceanica]
MRGVAKEAAAEENEKLSREVQSLKDQLAHFTGKQNNVKAKNGKRRGGGRSAANQRSQRSRSRDKDSRRSRGKSNGNSNPNQSSTRSRSRTRKQNNRNRNGAAERTTEGSHRDDLCQYSTKPGLCASYVSSHDLELWLTGSKVRKGWGVALGELASAGRRSNGAGIGSGGHQRTPAASMSCIAADGSPADVCANCGKGSSGGEGGVKLKDCTACRLVKYCGVDCQRAHRKKHKKACKQRAAELKDEQLFSQGLERPERHICPICALPIPLPTDYHSVVEVCCMKLICNGCDHAAEKRGMDDCAFCRTPCPDNDADKLAMIRARVSKKDPEAINHLGEKYCHGLLGLQKDMRRAVKLWTEAAELGSIEALYSLGLAYKTGEGIQQDEAKGVEFYKKAAVQGHVISRYKLGCVEGQKGNYDRAAKHFLIAAKMGLKESVENIKSLFMAGVATKEQYAEALKGYQDAVEEMKSHDRDEASAFRKS